MYVFVAEAQTDTDVLSEIEHTGINTSLSGLT